MRSVNLPPPSTNVYGNGQCRLFMATGSLNGQIKDTALSNYLSVPLRGSLYGPSIQEISPFLNYMHGKLSTEMWLAPGTLTGSGASQFPGGG